MAVRMPAQQEHRYQLCRDDDCDRFPCRVYKDGYRGGYEDGRRRGYAEGYADGYGAGFGEGLASCPGPHGG
jgi:hypothetical protein